MKKKFYIIAIIIVIILLFYSYSFSESNGVNDRINFTEYDR
jgi:hypothetical protein